MDIEIKADEASEEQVVNWESVAGHLAIHFAGNPLITEETVRAARIVACYAEPDGFASDTTTAAVRDILLEHINDGRRGFDMPPLSVADCIGLREGTVQLRARTIFVIDEVRA